MEEGFSLFFFLGFPWLLLGFSMFIIFCLLYLQKKIIFFKFTTWPDFGVPEDTDQFLEFLEEVRRTREMLLTTSTQNQKEIISLEAEGSSQSNNPPIVCHCSVCFFFKFFFERMGLGGFISFLRGCIARG